MRTLRKLCCRQMLVDASLLAARYSASKVVSDSACIGSVGESEVSACVGGRDERCRWESAYRSPQEMVTLS